MHLDSHVLEIQEDFDNLFLNALDGAVLMVDTVDLDFHHGAAGYGGQQNTTQSIS